jgi:hypothetical protein
MERLAAAVGAAGGLLGSGMSIILAQAGALDSTSALVGLATNGPIAAVAVFLLWRSREKDREHAQEREADRARLAAERQEDRLVLTRLTDEIRESNGVLAGVLEHMREDKKK